MAIRKQHLHHRIKGQAANHAAHMAAAEGHPSAATVSGITQMPVSMVLVNPVSSNYATLAMQEVLPIVTADGAMIPATAPGRWDQLYQAGRT
jgi:hypothetical protein